MGFKPPATSKFCCAQIIIVSMGCDMFSFLFLPSQVIEKLCILLSFILGFFPLIFFKLKFQVFFSDFLSIKNFKKWLASSNFISFSAVLPEKRLKEPYIDSVLLMAVANVFLVKKLLSYKK